MKLAVLGGGGVRMPAFVRAVLAGGANIFDEISLFEPDPVRRQTTGDWRSRSPASLATQDVVTQTADPAGPFQAPASCSRPSGWEETKAVA